MNDEEERRCPCCERVDDVLRRSPWHGQEQICSACFIVWYDTGITEPHELGEEVLRRERNKEFPFRSDRP